MKKIYVDKAESSWILEMRKEERLPKGKGVGTMKESDLILPQKEIVKPTNTSRRGFLRFLGVTSMTLAVPSLILPKKKEIITEIDTKIRPRVTICSGWSGYLSPDDLVNEKWWITE